MSNKPNRSKPSRPSARSAPSSGAAAPPAPPKRSLPWLWVGLGAVIVLALGFAILSGGDDEELSVGSVPAVGDSTAAPGTAQAEVWPVTITGTPLGAFPGEGADPAIGQTAPTLSGYAFDGSPVAIDPSKGPVMLVYLAHWCSHCNAEIPELLAWKASGAVPDDLQVIGITTAVDPSQPNYPPSSWMADKQWSWPVLADSETQDASVAMGLTSFPFTVILDTDGTVLTRWAGEKGADGIQQAVDAALA